ncbi:MAG: pantoate--beta-alanine ligase [Candidatus Promineifilaceae bacterium]|nr:pantoate--beta-alanine ligase [Candidatus Promineifilaceae bacterium]
MIVTADIVQTRAIRWAEPTLSWGMVPTMGALHEGHLSLVRQAVEENDRTLVSIYVNPAQFDRPSDLAAYPRDLDHDIELLRQAGVDVVFTPDDQSMYPDGFQTTVHVAEVTKPLEGAARPGHFDGVATIVTKLFNIGEPTRAYFGQKDAQQVAVVRRLITDLNFSVKLMVCPIVRDPDGLALSSRNARLTPNQRRAAPVLYQALSAAATRIKQGEDDAARIRRQMQRRIEGERLARIDYVSVADPDSLTEIDSIEDRALLSLAVYFGEIRLIDNMVIEGANDLE